ncbi:unnamed protein product [Gongylonema pulchrum]|uniref:DUF1876 domain-containing protein n=1 Tax=Gongylonema pulchrum TaxID=637853 RepID=A0A183ELB6_9BILA|nr:unnamed protein product [Gongylonema pulchrum]
MMTAADEIYHVVCDKNKLQSSDVELRLESGFEMANDAAEAARNGSDVELRLESGFEMANDAAEAARNVYTDLSVKNRSRSKILELYA